MRFRVTARGEGIELRGYVDADEPYQVARLFADDFDESGVLILSPATDDWSPFDEPKHPPTFEDSLGHIQSIMRSSSSPEEAEARLAHLHMMQAQVIRAERAISAVYKATT